MKLLPIAFLIILISLSAAISVMPNYIQIKDTGSQSLPTMNVGITIDCDSKAVTVDVLSNQTGLPVAGATTSMFYTDYGYYPLPNPGTTDSNGMVVLQVPGNIHYLTALFVLRVDQASFQSRQIEYNYQKCFETQPAQTTNSTQNQTPPTTVVNSTENQTPSENTSLPIENNSINQTQNSSSLPVVQNTTTSGNTSKSTSVCPVGFLLSLLFVGMRLRR